MFSEILDQCGYGSRLVRQVKGILHGPVFDAGAVDKAAQDISLTQKADQAVVVVNDRQSGDFALHHDHRGFFERIFTVQGIRLRCHDLLYLHLREKIVELVNVQRGRFGRGSIFYIAICYDSDQFAVRDNRQSSDSVFFHDSGGAHQRGVLVNSQDISCHPIFNQHIFPSLHSNSIININL